MTPLALDLPTSVLAALMDLSGVARDAPLRAGLGPAAPLDGPVLHRLAGVGAVEIDSQGHPVPTPSVRSACLTLARPLSHTRVHLSSAGWEIETAAYFPDLQAAQPGVGLTPIGDRCRLTAPISYSAVGALIEERFLATSRAPGSPFRALLSAETARTLFAILDWIRCAGGIALDGGAAGPVIVFDPDAAWNHFASGVTRSSGVLFNHYLRLLLGPEVEFDRELWTNALGRLRQAGLLQETPRGWALGAPVRDLAHTSTVIQAALGWSTARRSDDSDSVEVHSRIVLALGDRLLLALDRIDDDVVVHTPSVDALRSEIIGHAAEAAAPTTRRFCRKCGTKARPGKAFCVSCGVSMVR